jgi:hypothetical protein
MNLIVEFSLPISFVDLELTVFVHLSDASFIELRK